MLAQIIIENGVKKIIPLTADAGAGAPVGTIIPMYKKSSPSGYLYCDGSTFDETKYPLLYAYLGSNVLPDYREFALVGAEENTTDVYNASTNPNGTIHDHDVYTEGQAKDDQLQAHIHALQGEDQVNGAYSGNTGWKVVTAGGLENGGLVLSNTTQENNGRKGTVTRGKRKAVYFYIKATSGLAENQQENVLNAINENNSYSTTEHATGATWIDGKPIYRKVYYRSETNPFQYNSITLESGFATTKNLIRAEGVIKLNTDNIVQLPYIDASDTMEIFIDQYGNLNTFTLNATYNVYWYKIITEYTKTTD